MPPESEGPRPPHHADDQPEVIEGQFRVLDSQPPRPRPGLRPTPRTGFPFTMPGEQQSALRNPYVLAGLAVGAAILLAVFVVVVFGGGGSGSGSGGSNGDGNGGGSSLLTPGPGRGVAARSIATATVREGPDATSTELGTLRNGRDVEVIGRSADSKWFAIYYPPGSQLQGWVPASALRVPGDPAVLQVIAVTPVSRPTIAIPTATREPAATETPSPTPTGTATPAGGPDLMPSIVAGTCQVGVRLLVNVRNVGTVPLTERAISVLVQTPEGVQRQLVSTSPVTLAPGASRDIDTNYVVQERIIVILDPLGTLGDSNTGNNRADCVVSVTPTPTGATVVPSPGVSPTASPVASPTPTRTPTPVGP